MSLKEDSVWWLMVSLVALVHICVAFVVTKQDLTTDALIGSVVLTYGGTLGFTGVLGVTFLGFIIVAYLFVSEQYRQYMFGGLLLTLVSVLFYNLNILF